MENFTQALAVLQRLLTNFNYRNGVRTFYAEGRDEVVCRNGSVTIRMMRFDIFSRTPERFINIAALVNRTENGANKLTLKVFRKRELSEPMADTVRRFGKGQFGIDPKTEEREVFNG